MTITAQLIEEVFKQGQSWSKHDMSRRVFCAARTAQYLMRRFHKARKCHIVGWEQIYNNGTPIYKWGEGEDAPKPPPQTGAERSLRHRKNAEANSNEALLKNASKRRARRKEFKGLHKNKFIASVFGILDPIGR